MNANTMKAVVASGYGAPDVLQVQEVKKPQVGEHGLLIKVYATSATTADTMMRTGKPYYSRLFIGLLRPKHPIPGTGFAGIVESVGSKVARFQPGDKVFGETTFGFSTNAEYIAISENGVVQPMPEGMSFAEATTFCDGPLTSLNFLSQIARLKSGQKILINGASGSLGTAAVQLARYFGAHVTGVCSTRNVGLVKSLGADVVIDYTQEDFTKGAARYNIIFDTVGKCPFEAARKALTPDGQYISPVLSMKLLRQMIWTSRFGRQKAIFSATGMVAEDALRNMLGSLIDIYTNGHLKIVIDRQYPLEKVADAHSYIATGRKKGNVIIAVVA
jgi:NADPH:quinone reductase-like Zn-dependent oxidoreductase